MIHPDDCACRTASIFSAQAKHVAPDLESKEGSTSRPDWPSGDDEKVRRCQDCGELIGDAPCDRCAQCEVQAGVDQD